MYLAPFVPVNMEKEENHAGSWIPVLGLQLALCVSSGRNVHADSPCSSSNVHQQRCYPEPSLEAWKLEEHQPEPGNSRHNMR